MPKAIKITSKDLRAQAGCRREVVRFQRCFPHGASVTMANARIAADKAMDLVWFGRRMFCGSARTIFERKVRSLRKKLQEDRSETYYQETQALGKIHPQFLEKGTLPRDLRKRKLFQQTTKRFGAKVVQIRRKCHREIGYSIVRLAKTYGLIQPLAKKEKS
jgi:hypothetical protein